MKSKAFISVLLLALFTVSALTTVYPVSAIVYGTVAISKPDMVVPGGAIELDLRDFDADRAMVYFYFSTNDDPEIFSDDIRLTEMSRDDVEDEVAADNLITIFVPITVSADDYYVKVTDYSVVGAVCIVSDWTVEVITEDLPTITVDPESDTVPTLVKVDGSGISTNYVSADLYWDDYEEWIGTGSVSGGVFTVEDAPIPESFMGSHKIAVLLSNGDTFGTFAEFRVEPSVDITPPAAFSIGAGELDQHVYLWAHGFPEGIINADTVEFIVKDFLTGNVIETITAVHPEIDVEDVDPWKGTFAPNAASLETIVDEAPEGVIDLQFTVNGLTFTLANQFFSSATRDPGRFTAKMDKTSGKIGDVVTFSAIGFPEGVDVNVIFESEDGWIISLDDLGEPLPNADLNGAWRYEFELRDLPIGLYDVRVIDETNSRYKRIGTFTVKPKPEDAIILLEELETEIDDLTSVDFKPRWPWWWLKRVLSHEVKWVISLVERGRYGLARLMLNNWVHRQIERWLVDDTAAVLIEKVDTIISILELL